MALTDTAIKNLKPHNAAKKYSDGGRLHLLVSPTGSKLWRLTYRFNGKQKLLAFGADPSVSLADARRRREDAKTLLAAGTDPSEQVKADRRRQWIV